MDDTEIHAQTRHICVTSVNRNNGPNADITPLFHHITLSVTVSKDPAGNSNRNVDALIDKHGLEAAAYYAGGTNDNENGAQKEISVAFAGVMERVDASDDANIRAFRYVNSVKRRPISLGDLFHVDNLIMQHARLAAWGDTEKRDHEQVHHRQAMQSSHSLHTAD